MQDSTKIDPNESSEEGQKSLKSYNISVCLALPESRVVLSPEISRPRARRRRSEEDLKRAARRVQRSHPDFGLFSETHGAVRALHLRVKTCYSNQEY